MPVTSIKSEVLVLTRDPEQLAKLQRKLKDYEARYGYIAPEVDPAGTYRYRLLKELLEKKLVDPAEFEEHYLTLDWHDQSAFTEAVAIIKSYNSGDLSKIRVGTGTGLK